MKSMPLAPLLCLSIALALSSPGHARWRAASPAIAPSAIVTAAKAGMIEPASSAFVNATAVMPFSEGSIYHLYTAPERVTDIALQPGEALVAVASGDTARWVIGDTSSGSGADKRVHVLVKPFAAKLATNLLITTDRRTYHVALTSGSGASMSAASWIYPQDALIALQQAQEKAVTAAPVAPPLDVDQLHFNYAISGGTPDWRPLRAFDDGRQTYIEFAPSLAVGEAPPLFLIDAKGAVELVNYRIRGRYYVVDRLFDAAELRLGTKHQTIVRISRVYQNKSPARGKARP